MNEPEQLTSSFQQTFDNTIKIKYKNSFHVNSHKSVNPPSNTPMNLNHIILISPTNYKCDIIKYLQVYWIKVHILY
jgi:hypothetical protein